ncbi:condensation domain-containing protein [Kibdelosporangium lantanae]|uniref:Condensation domain-containing protein n=1 Tax=Kibdelosporangium lantanae TaxID=1497396 RepID=A0ABW3M279_9PSEU
MFTYLFSTFQLLLSVHGGQTDFVVGYPVTLRRGRRMRGSIGYFVNTLPFRARVDPDGSFDELLDRTSRKLWRGSMHREYPYAMMPRLLDTPREPNRAGLISTMFVITDGDPGDPFTEVREPGRRTECAGLGISEFYLPQQQGQFDITLQVHAASARAQIKYNTSLFTEETARGLADRYNALLTESLRTKATL